jgi:acyl carrier protein
MTLNEFLEEVTEILELDNTINVETSLEELEEYDSLAIMSLIAFFDENFEIEVTGEQLIEVKLVSDLISIAGNDKLK